MLSRLGPVHFFDPAEVGIEVKAANAVVRIKKVDQQKVFAKAGLRSEDVVLALDKLPIKSVSDFRKHLRHSLARESVLLFEIERSGKSMTVLVRPKGGTS